MSYRMPPRPAFSGVFGLVHHSNTVAPQLLYFSRVEFLLWDQFGTAQELLQNSPRRNSVHPRISSFSRDV